jgi:hypothetical protein
MDGMIGVRVKFAVFLSGFGLMVWFLMVEGDGQKGARSRGPDGMGAKELLCDELSTLHSGLNQNRDDVWDLALIELRLLDVS